MLAALMLAVGVLCGVAEHGEMGGGREGANGRGQRLSGSVGARGGRLLVERWVGPMLRLRGGGRMQGGGKGGKRGREEDEDEDSSEGSDEVQRGDAPNFPRGSIFGQDGGGGEGGVAMIAKTSQGLGGRGGVGGGWKGGGAGGGEAEEKAYGVLVRGLSGLKAEDVEKVFEVCGEIVSVKTTAQGKAIVYFANRVSAGRACKVNGTEHSGRTLLTSSLPPGPPPAKKAVRAPVELSFPVAVNDVPKGFLTDDLRNVFEKFGPVIKVRSDLIARSHFRNMVVS